MLKGVFNLAQTITQIKAVLVGIKPDAGIIGDASIIQLINEVDGSIHCNIYKNTLPTDIAVTADTAEYSLPAGITFDLVDQVYLNDFELIKIDESYSDTTGFMRGSTANKVKVYPVPETSDVAGSESLRVAYLNPFVEHTTMSDTVLVDSPFNKMYYQYLSAMISLFKEDTATYNNMISLYNASFNEYEQWYNERYTNRKA